ncbi:hypothetical protein JTB14_015495 [Gonioctena quinquepunctata]|nr:hypothetical protein JTB14_015495 [Gonioctena quinquepunctata]
MAGDATQKDVKEALIKLIGGTEDDLKNTNQASAHCPHCTAFKIALNSARQQEKEKPRDTRKPRITSCPKRVPLAHHSIWQGTQALMVKRRGGKISLMLKILQINTDRRRKAHLLAKKKADILLVQEPNKKLGHWLYGCERHQGRDIISRYGVTKKSPLSLRSVIASGGDRSGPEAQQAQPESIEQLEIESKTTGKNYVGHKNISEEQWNLLCDLLDEDPWGQDSGRLEPERHLVPEPPSLEEMAVDKMKPRKAPGPDGILPEAIKLVFRTIQTRY